MSSMSQERLEELLAIYEDKIAKLESENTVMAQKITTLNRWVEHLEAELDDADEVIEVLSEISQGGTKND